MHFIKNNWFKIGLLIVLLIFAFTFALTQSESSNEDKSQSDLSTGLENVQEILKKAKSTEEIPLSKGNYLSANSLPIHSVVCFSNKKLNCLQGECSEITPKTFLLLNKGLESQISRCDETGCSTFNASVQSSGFYDNWQLEQPSGYIFKREVGPEPNFVDIATQNLSTVMSFGYCEPAK